MSRLWKGPTGLQENKDAVMDSGHVPVDIVGKADKVIIRASVPGVNPEDLEVIVHNGNLTIRGKERNREPTEGEYLMKERPVGLLSRTVQVPDSADIEQGESWCELGVLTITFPKLEEKQPKRLKVMGTAPTPNDEKGKTREAA